MQDTYGNQTGGPGGTGVNPREAVSVPAIMLMVVAGLTLLSSLANLIGPSNEEALRPLMDNPEFPQSYKDGITWLFSTTGRILLILPSLVVSGLIFVGALKMKNLQSYGLAMTAAILALIPCCSCYCVGIPVGIWALVVLNKPEVKAAFT